MTCGIASIEQGVNQDVFQTDGLDVLVDSLDGEYSGANSRPFNRNTGGTKLLEKWDLPSHGSGIRVGSINRDTGTRDLIPFNFLRTAVRPLAL